jgi:hypothetical protein
MRSTYHCQPLPHVIGPTVSEYYELIRLPAGHRFPHHSGLVVLPIYDGNLQGLPSSWRISSCMPRPEDPGSPPKSHLRSVLRASPAKSLRFLYVGFVDVKTLADCDNRLSRLYQHLGEHSLPCGLQDSLRTLHLFCSLRTIRNSATGATLDTGGWLTLSRQGLAPCKMHQASLGALTFADNQQALILLSWQGPSAKPRQFSCLVDPPG